MGIGERDSHSLLEWVDVKMIYDSQSCRCHTRLHGAVVLKLENVVLQDWVCEGKERIFVRGDSDATVGLE